MNLHISYQNDRGTVDLCGNPLSPFGVTDIYGLGVPDREYVTASYSGYDGQETVSSTILPRSITLSCDAVSDNLPDTISTAADILSAPGWLCVQNEYIGRRIYCNQTVFPDMKRILSGKICSFAIQFVCDSPFFENVQDISVPLYKRTKELSTRFSLPSVFGITVAEADILPDSRYSVEPIIRIVCPSSVANATSVILTNQTSGKKIELLYAMSAGEEIVIDIKNRTVTSSISGNIIDCLSDDTFLGDFVFSFTDNHITAFVGDINNGIFIECLYTNKYIEAILI